MSVIFSKPEHEVQGFFVMREREVMKTTRQKAQLLMAFLFALRQYNTRSILTFQPLPA
jgi:hypothetical protein